MWDLQLLTFLLLLILLPTVLCRKRILQHYRCSGIASQPPSSKPKKNTRNSGRSRKIRTTRAGTPLVEPQVVQPIEVFLVVDIEATCQQGADLNFPNEIIEFPVCLLQWKDRTPDGRAGKLEIVAEFRSYVKPSWRPLLTGFCTDLTGITQEQVNDAPLFPQVLAQCRQFLVDNGVIDPDTERPLARYCWCSDGPFDVRDFMVKQCFISKISLPIWLQRDVLDVRMAVSNWLKYRTAQGAMRASGVTQHLCRGLTKRSLNIPAQLRALGLSEFEGRLHSGIDDSRNISRVIVELARRGIILAPNTTIYPRKRWSWMGKHGQIIYHI
ncbi:hypothetical protein M378DRAFT_900973 [Amanita muscaria Koide BX008]|uniref:Exonuclease domain-containing protein n=1 Tax=Amanita muscaria (strain Koide BX008) TaxID=946122 RepID=A0A0C2XGS9_AMAMK|nr:hypothetical protein M378DRAFT_900973 [Amanita muscaria Koide BX008]